MTELTQEYLKTIFSYNPLNGNLTRLISTSNVVKVGGIAKSIGNHGYVGVWINGKNHLVHRLAWLYVYGVFPKDKLDHINNIKTDNRISNLRECSNIENLRNIGKYKNNKSGYRGVSWCKPRNKWQANAKLDGKQYYLGRFDSAEDASAAYESFAKEHHGEFYKNQTIETATIGETI